MRGVDDAQLDVRVIGAKAREKRREPEPREAEIDADAHAAAHVARILPQRIDGALQRCVVPAYVGMEQLPAARQHEALADTIEELDAERVLERGDTLAHRRRRPPQLGRRPTDAAVLGDGGEDVQLVEVELFQQHRT